MNIIIIKFYLFITIIISFSYYLDVEKILMLSNLAKKKDFGKIEIEEECKKRKWEEGF